MHPLCCAGLPAEWDVTAALGAVAAGAVHTLALMVVRWSDGSYLEDQGYSWCVDGVSQFSYAASQITGAYLAFTGTYACI